MVLPTASRDAEAGRSENAVPPFENRYRVLVAEDHPANQALMQWRLARIGLEATIVDHGKAARDALRAATFDVVITDWRMPEMDGPQLLAAIRTSDAHFRRLPAIALTANLLDDPGDGGEHRFDDVLRTPASLVALRRALARALGVADERVGTSWRLASSAFDQGPTTIPLVFPGRGTSRVFPSFWDVPDDRSHGPHADGFLDRVAMDAANAVSSRQTTAAGRRVANRIFRCSAARSSASSSREPSLSISSFVLSSVGPYSRPVKRH